MDIPSPDEFSRLGVCEPRKLAELTALALGDFLVFGAIEAESPLDILFLTEVEELVEAEVEGRVGVGGCGNEPMLTVFRTALEGIADAFSTGAADSCVDWRG